MTDLTRKEAFLLDWLLGASSSAYGECAGADLDRLLDLGLAITTGRNGHDRVRLTAEGDREATERARRTERRP